MKEDCDKQGLIKDITQNNDAGVSIQQKNIIIICSDIFNETNLESEQLEDILGEKFKLEINERGEVRLNNKAMQIKKLENGLNALVLEEEVVT
ncbi:hypothetical protein [Halanaerobacter jeridensis]|uniref:Uncharacterized protein n=1 Tax=Halanaerobacter jeridensis TaxID=706427 RepID=A0A939BPB8_9FIRM|nr:hypothetical protein [Halanaerobacter jeridensis]MBM7556613.1 hypothetical protein [Halanaerobacter jeridensis]